MSRGGASWLRPLRLLVYGIKLSTLTALLEVRQADQFSGKLHMVPGIPNTVVGSWGLDPMGRQSLF